MGAKGPRAAESALGPRALVSSHGQRCRHNLAHDSSHDPARDPAHDPARDRVAVAAWRWPGGGGRVAVAVWRWPCGGHMTCHVTWQDNPLRVTLRGLVLPVRVLLLNILCVRDSRLCEIGGLPEFSDYFIPYFRGGIRAAVSSAVGGGDIII